MKLHLPKLLRKAVIACMTVVTGLTTTVGAGAFIGGVALFALSGRTAQAAYDSTTGIISGTDNESLKLNELAIPEGKTLTFEMGVGNAGGSNWFGGSQTYAADIILNGGPGGNTGMCINNGNGSSVITFSGNVTGDGIISKIGPGTDMKIEFTGDASAMTGAIKLNSTVAFTLRFAGTTNGTATKGVSGTGDITFSSGNDTLEYSYAASETPVYVTNKISKSGSGSSKINLTGGADYVFTKNITVTDLTVNGGSVGFTSTWTTLNKVTLNGDVAISATVLNSGADRTVFKNLTSTGQLTIGGQVVLSGTITLSKTAINNGTVYLYLTDGVSIDLSNLTAETSGSGKGATGTYTLFTGGNVIGASGLDEETGGWLTEVNLSDCSSDDIAAMLTGVETLGREWSYADGKLTYTITSVDLVWSSGSTLEWKVGTEFDGGAVFANGDNVIFAEGLGDVTATLTENIKVGKLTIKGGTDLCIAGSGKADVAGYVFEEGSGLTIGEGQDVTWAPLSVEGAPATLTVQGTFTADTGLFNNTDIHVEGGTMTIAGCNLSGDITVSDGGTLNINKGDAISYGSELTVTVDGGTLSTGANRLTVGAGNKYVLKNGTVVGTGDGYGVLDFYQNEGVLESSGTSALNGQLRFRNAGETTEIKVTDGELSINNGAWGGGTLLKTGEGILTINQAVSHGATILREGTLKLVATGTVSGGTPLTMEGGTLVVDTQNATTIAGISGTGSVTVAATAVGAGIDTITDFSGTITVAEGAELALGVVNLAAGKNVTVSGAVGALPSFIKTGEGQLTLEVLNVDGVFNMNGHTALSVTNFNIGSDAELVYGAGDVLEIGSVTDAVKLNVYGVADSLAEGINTGITLAEGQSADDLKALLTVDAVDSFTLTVKDGLVWLASTSEVKSDWDINWGAELALAPSTVTEGAIGTLAAGTDGTLKLYDLYGNTTYTPSEGVVAISLTGEGDANAIVFGGNDAHTDNAVGTVKTNVWIEANEGTYKAIVGGNYANNWNSGSRADFVGNTHIKIDGATVGTVMGGNYKDGKGALFTGNSYISVFSGSVTGAIVGAGVMTHNDSPKFIGDTNIFVYTALEGGSSKLHSEPADMVIGGFAWGTNAAGTYTVDGNTNITIDLTGYTGEATFGKHIVGGGYGGSGWQGGLQSHVVTGSTNIKMDLGTASMGTGIKVVGGNWNDAGGTDIGSTNITVLSGTFGSPIVGGSWIAERDTNHKIGQTNINISGGAVKGNVFGAHRVAGGSPTLIVGDVTILINGDAAVSGDIHGGNCIETQNENGVTASIDSVTITLDEDATVTGDIIGGNFCARNNNSNSTSIKTEEVVINLNDGSMKGSVYAGGYCSGNAVQTIGAATVNISSTVELAAGEIISGGFAGDNASVGVITTQSTLGLADAVEYTNMAGVNFMDFNAVSLGEGTKVTFATFGALNKELTVSGKGTMTVANASMALDKLTLSGATLKTDFGITSTAALTLKITEPSQLISRAGKDLTLAALDIDMTGATTGTPYVDIDGELKSLSKVNVNLTGVSSVAPGEYVLVKAADMGLTADDLVSTFDTEAPEGMEYVVEIVGNNLVFRSSFLSDWVWEGTTDGETNVWADNADGWKADGDGLTPNGQDVYFTAAGAGEVVVSGEVTPANVNITGGEYTFTAADADSGIKLGTDGVMSISAGVVVNMAMDNAELGGSTVLGGKLVLQSADAVGNTALKFNGGTLVYDTLTDDGGNKTHISTDLSTQASLADDYTGPVKIEVTDAENVVTWGGTDKFMTAVPGVQAALENGIEYNSESGEGTMHMMFKIGSNKTFNGGINVGGGEFYYTVGESTPTFTGAITVAEGAKLGFRTTRATIASDSFLKVSGAITGSGTVEVGEQGVSSGRYEFSGDNSAFAGTILLSGNNSSSTDNRALFTSAAAFGGTGTTVEVNGRGFLFSDSVTAVSSVKVTGATEGNLLGGGDGKTYTFTGAWIGDETSGFTAVNASMTIGLAGDLSDYKGYLKSDAKNTWVLGGSGVAGNGSLDMQELKGSGLFVVQYSSETTLNAVVSESAKLQQSGTGKLILAAENTSTGTLTVDADKEVQLGAANAAGSWAGSELAGEGTMTLVYGALTGLTTKADTATLAVKTTKKEVSTFAIGAGGGTVVDMTGSDAGLLDSIELAEGSTLIVDDDLIAGGALIVGGTGNTTLNMAFTTDNVGASKIDIVAMIQGGDVTIAGTEGVNLNMNNADVLTALNNIGEGDLYLQVTDGKLDTAAGVDINSVITPGLIGMGVRAQLTDEAKAGGYVIINGDVSGVYFTDNQEGSSADTADTVTVKDSSLEIYAGVVINKDDTLSVGTSTTINNLNGQEGGNLVITDNSSVVLNNSQLETGVDGYDPMGATNVLAGNLTGEEGTTITVDGAGGKLTVGGDLTADALTVAAGDLVAAGGGVVDALTVSDGATMTVGTGKSLELNNGSIAGVLKADDAGADLNTQGQVSVSGTISNMDMTVEDGSLVYLNNGEAYLNSLTVDSGATVMGTNGLVDVGASGPSSIAGKLTGSGTLSTSAGTNLTFDNATGSAGWNVTNKGDMTLDLTESGNLTLGALELANGSSTNVLFNSDNGTDGLLTLKDLTVGDTADITLSSTGSGQIAAGEYTLGTVDGTYDGADELTVNFSGTAFSQLDKANSYIYVDDQGNIVLNAVKSENNTLAESVTDPNAEAGAELLWNATAPVGGDLESAYNAVNQMIAAGDAAGANETMAAVAGASTAALGMAFAGDLERQLRAIRNRTTTMGVNQCVVNEGMPYVNAWVNAEGDRRSLDTDGVASGYELDSWGGTVGLDVDVNPNLTVGLALTAMYGNLTVDGPDTLEGDMDTYYVSAFARYSSGAWTHTFIGTIGMMDATTERTVNYGNGAYTAEGSTTGTAFGLMYEIGRVYALDDKGDTCLQPVFNVAYRHATVGSFEEENSDAGLRVDDQTVDTVTFGAGARLQTVVGENTFNRTSLLELRAMAKLDVGDTTSEADVALINGTGKGIIESAEMGAFGVELGMGLHIPVGDENDGTIFIDVSAEFRSGYTNINGTVGYRINF